MIEWWALIVMGIIYVGIVSHAALHRADSVKCWTVCEDFDTMIALELLYDRLKEVEKGRQLNLQTKEFIEGCPLNTRVWEEDGTGGHVYIGKIDLSGIVDLTNLTITESDESDKELRELKGG